MEESWLLASNGDDLSIENGIERIRSRNSELEKQQALLYRLQLNELPRLTLDTADEERKRELSRRLTIFFLRIWR